VPARRIQLLAAVVGSASLGAEIAAARLLAPWFGASTIIWDRATGQPVHNAIVWQDTRTDSLVKAIGGAEGADRLRALSGCGRRGAGCRWRRARRCGVRRGSR